MASSQPERFLLLEGVDSATQKALESDDEDFYGYNSETSDDNFDENPREDRNEDSVEEGDEEEYDPNSFENTIQSRVKCVTSGKVSRTSEGSASGILVPVNDPLYQAIDSRLSENCCDLGCLSAFNTDEIYQFHLNLLEMTKDEKSMLLLGKLHVLSNAGDSTSHARKKGPKRARVTYNYAFDHREVCKKAFIFLHDISEKQFKNIAKHLKDNGPVPMIHGNTGKVPKTTYPYEVTHGVVQFIKNFAEIHGLPQPSARRGRADVPPVYLPASHNYKTVHDIYVKSVMEKDASQRVMQYRSFIDVWHKCIPEVQFMTPRTDVCAVCEQYREKIKTAVSEEDKISFTSQFSDHLIQAQAERQSYMDSCLSSKTELSKNSVPNFAHYTFDFAEQLHLPHHSRQVGPMYFKVGRKVQLFGICCDGNNTQVNYLVDESETIGKNGTKSHGANSVVSMLDHYFSTHSLKESICYCHADNCVGQNKNRFVIGYFAWRVITGKHTQIHLSFMEVGHTRCLVDGHFGLIKKSYRRMDCDTLQHIVEAVRRSTINNIPQLFAWQWRNWETLVDPLFKPIPHIRKYHHFRFDASSPGKVYIKEHTNSTEREISIFKKGITAAKVQKAKLPTAILPAGLTRERQEYLYKEVRPYVRSEYQDITCPPLD